MSSVNCHLGRPDRAQCPAVGRLCGKDDAPWFSRTTGRHYVEQSSVCVVRWRDFRAPFVGRPPEGGAAYSACSVKEVIQPQVPLRLPCYDFAPVTALAFGGSTP